MEDIKKAIRLYEMMAKRLGDSGYGLEQAKIYSEMADFMKDCASVREAHEKIKNSEYYLAPGAALLKDKLKALAKASYENEMADVARVYEEKIAEINADVNAMYELGYERKAMNLKIPYIETYEAFGRLYSNYFVSIHGNLADDVAKESSFRDLEGNLAKLTKPQGGFLALAGKDKFRKLIPATDEGYEIFVKTIADIIRNGPDFTQDIQEQASEFEKIKEALKSEKDIVREVGIYNRMGLKRSRVKVTAPDTKEAGYSYSDEEVRPFD